MKNNYLLILAFLIFFSLFITSNIVENNQIREREDKKFKNSDNEILKSSSTVVSLSAGGYLNFSDYLSNEAIVEWSFNDIRSRANITLMVMTQNSLNNFVSNPNSSFFSFILSDGTLKDDSGTWVAPYEATWFFVFWNNNDMNTQITYELDITNFFELEITRPASSGYWLVGSNQSIQWLYYNDFINLELYKNDIFQFVIATNIPGEVGNYYWTIPSTLESNATYSIRISDNNGNFANSVFINIFQENPNPTTIQPTPSITSPSTTKITKTTTSSKSSTVIISSRTKSKITTVNESAFTSLNLEFFSLALLLVCFIKFLMKRKKY
ncbi:MAG: hypothetical protein ACXAC7_14795 [Candidatus Hodarchaeales archaeon]|jgi:hypothetical protein